LLRTYFILISRRANVNHEFEKNTIFSCNGRVQQQAAVSATGLARLRTRLALQPEFPAS
jgi:hypothetical protein